MSWENNVRKVIPYVPGERPKQKNIIKLNTNECPYPPTIEVEKVLSSMDHRELRLYPDPLVHDLAESLANHYEVTMDEMFVGVGSDDVLAMIFMTFFHGTLPILFPDITYSFYPVWAQLYRIPYCEIPLKDDYTISAADYLRENGGIVIANPNAPTGVAMPLAEIEKIVAANPASVVVVDEAYIDFGGESALPLIRKYDNVLVVQTFSKSRAMAGIRIGYAMGCPHLIRYLSDAKFAFNSYTMNMTSIACGVAAVKDDAYFKDICSKIIATREWFGTEIEKLGFSCLPSSANFLFVKHDKIHAKDILHKLREQGILVRYFAKPDRISNYLRISIGTDEEMRILVSALEVMVKEGIVI